MSTVSVRGGLDVIRARPDELRAAAPLFTRLAAQVDEVAQACSATYWGLWTAASLGPGAPAALAALQDAHATLLDVHASLAAAADDLRAIGSRLARAADRYATADALGRGLFQDVLADLGATWHALGPALHGLARLPHATLAGVGTALGTGSPAAGFTTFLTDDPQVVDDALVAAGLWPQFRLVERLLTGLYPDGSPRVRPAGIDVMPQAAGPPRDLADLIAGVAWRNTHEQQTTTTEGGEIDVKFLHHADGSRSVIVDLPGTRKLLNAPGHDEDVTDVATNLRALRGVPTTYEEGVLVAMRRAGVRPEDHVLLVGHSQGGMVAVELARDAVRSRRFDVTDVITAGSPIGLTAGQLPSSVHVLALENTHDVVPEADGRANPATPNVITVTGDVDLGTIGGNHSLPGAYEPIARATQHDADPAVRYFLAGADEFLDAETVRTRRYVIMRY